MSKGDGFRKVQHTSLKTFNSNLRATQGIGWYFSSLLGGYLKGFVLIAYWFCSCFSYFLHKYLINAVLFETVEQALCLWSVKPSACTLDAKSQLSKKEIIHVARI